MLHTDILIPELPAPWGTVGSALAYDDEDSMSWAQRAVHTLSMYPVPLGSVITIGQVGPTFPRHILPPDVDREKLIVVTWYSPGVNNVADFIIWMAEAKENLPTVRRVEGIAMTFAGVMAAQHGSAVPDVHAGPVVGVIGVDRQANLCQVIFGEKDGNAQPVSILGTPLGDTDIGDAGPVLDGGPYNAMRQMVGLPIANRAN
jgi:hypothetical protein